MRAKQSSRTVQILLALLIVVPVLIGTGFAAATNLEFSRAWSSSPEETGGAPIADSPSGIDPAELVAARRAAGEAGTQAGFLSTGTGELKDGVGQLVDGAVPLTEGVGAAAAGSQELHNGLVQLQAATGQLGDGAVQVADGIQVAVEQLTGVVVVQQQILAGIDDVDSRLAASNDPASDELREQLDGLRGQVQNFALDVEATDQLDELRRGSREIANQLAVPGHPFHDGIYTATNGARDLAYGLGELQGGVDVAIDGISELDEGATRLDDMAELNQNRVTSVQRALPVVQGTAVDATGESVDEGGSSLPPMYAFLISALVMLAGAGLGWAYFVKRWQSAVAILGIIGIGAVALFTVASQMSVTAFIAATAILTLAAVASTTCTRVLSHLVGQSWSTALTIVGWIVQIGVVGYVWSGAALEEASLVWRALAGLMPLHYPTFALTSLGNDGSLAVVGLGAGVLVGIIAIGMVYLLVLARSAPDEAESEEHVLAPVG